MDAPAVLVTNSTGAAAADLHINFTGSGVRPWWVNGIGRFAGRLPCTHAGDHRRKHGGH